VSQSSDPVGLASAYGQLLGLPVEAPEIDAFFDKMVRVAHPWACSPTRRTAPAR
jgi:hypothetical protein